MRSLVRLVLRFIFQKGGSFARTSEAVRGLRVGDLMVRAPVTARPDATLGQFVAEIAVAGRQFTTYPVVDADGRVVGLLPFERVARTPRWEWDLRLVGELALPLRDVTVLHEDEPVIEAFEELRTGFLHRGLVLRDGRLAGLVSLADIARAVRT